LRGSRRLGLFPQQRQLFGRAGALAFGQGPADI